MKRGCLGHQQKRLRRLGSRPGPSKDRILYGGDRRWPDGIHPFLLRRKKLTGSRIGSGKSPRFAVHVMYSGKPTRAWLGEILKRIAIQNQIVIADWKDVARREGPKGQQLVVLADQTS